MAGSRTAVSITAYEVKQDGSVEEVRLLVEPPSMFTMRDLVKGGFLREQADLARRAKGIAERAEAKEEVEDDLLDLIYDRHYWSIRVLAVLIRQSDPKHGTEEWLGRVITQADVPEVERVLSVLFPSEQEGSGGGEGSPNAEGPSPTR